MLTSSSMLNLHRALVYTGIDLDDIMQTDCLAYKYLALYRFSLFGYNIWYCVVCDYRGTLQISPITRVIFYVRRIWLYLYKYRIYGTITIYILKGLAPVYHLIKILHH